MSTIQLIIVLLILLVLYFLLKLPVLADKEVIPQYSTVELRWLKKEVVYSSLEGEIQTVSLNPSDDKSHCYQNVNRIYCEELIRTSDIEKLQKELTENEEYLKIKLQESLYQQHIIGLVPKLKVLRIAVQNGKFIIGMELV
jgi:hypothetical protein